MKHPAFCGVLNASLVHSSAYLAPAPAQIVVMHMFIMIFLMSDGEIQVIDTDVTVQWIAKLIQSEAAFAGQLSDIVPQRSRKSISSYRSFTRRASQFAMTV